MNTTSQLTTDDIKKLDHLGFRPLGTSGWVRAGDDMLSTEEALSFADSYIQYQKLIAEKQAYIDNLEQWAKNGRLFTPLFFFSDGLHPCGLRSIPSPRLRSIERERKELNQLILDYQFFFNK